MIETSTVLVLGAGASSHLGYPIGQDLLNSVCRRIQTNVYEKSILEHCRESQVQAFFRRLSHSAYYSVDTFLEDRRNSDLLELGKLCIADALKVQERPEQPFAPNAPGWYQHLFNRMDTGSANDIPDNKLAVITFNYDRSLEFYLHQTMTYRYHLSEDESLDILRKLTIIHPHGILGDYPAVPYSPEVDSATLCTISAAIKIVHEFEDSTKESRTPEFSQCSRVLADADKIYFLGFGFHEENVRRMHFFDKDTVAARDVLGTTWALLPKEKEDLLARMSKYGFSQDHLPRDGINCNNFFSYLGALD